MTTTRSSLLLVKPEVTVSGERQPLGQWQWELQTWELYYSAGQSVVRWLAVQCAGAWLHSAHWTVYGVVLCDAAEGG